MKTTFNIDGPATVSYIGKKAFEDKMTWNAQGELVLVKSNAEDGTEITATRSLSPDGRVLVMVRAAWAAIGLLLAHGFQLNARLVSATPTETVRPEPQGREGDARGADVRKVVTLTPLQLEPTNQPTPNARNARPCRGMLARGNERKGKETERL